MLFLPKVHQVCWFLQRTHVWIHWFPPFYFSAFLVYWFMRLQLLLTFYLYYFWFVPPYLGSCGEGNGTSLQYSCLEHPMDRGAWWAAVHGVAKSQARLSDFIFTFHFHALEKEMATHSSVLAWRIPGTEEPSGLPSMGSHRVGHDSSDLAAASRFLR